MGHTWSLPPFLFTWVLLNSCSQVTGPGMTANVTGTYIDTGNCISEGVPSLNKTEGDDVLFQLHLKVGNETQRIRLYLEPRNLLLLTIYPGENNSSRIIPHKEYEGRLSVADDKSVILLHVTSEDSGCYEIHTSSVSGNINIQKFNLTVFGTVNSESHMNLWIGLATGISVVLLAIYFFFGKIPQRLLNRIKGIYRRRRNIPPVPNDMEERSLEEGDAIVQMASLLDQETQTRTQEALPATTTQDHEGVMLATVCTPQESSREQPRQQQQVSTLSIDGAYWRQTVPQKQGSRPFPTSSTEGHRTLPLPRSNCSSYIVF
ncbi:uncharacterized protein LOC110211880 isoform X2 [Phascolarctos cinereus]|uniref:Uncharacterized protein LOC110211880 isoform X2 n=1 Tax=Phascolarctos cinereus TaxID=38626 RepID=A0A6P5KN96_PHACI|nr:uncharacterized protein LOC110211880 isoform X2 [Phascolarctos cinereus]